MRWHAVLLGIFFISLTPFSADAQTFSSPTALLSALYSNQGNTDSDGPSPYSAYFSDHLNEILQADQDKTPQGEVGAIDFDPVISGQDGKASRVRIGVPLMLDDRAEVEVTFRNGESVTLYYTLVREHGGWKVDDIANQAGEYPWSLSALLNN